MFLMATANLRSSALVILRWLEQNWFISAHVGTFLGLRHIDTWADGLNKHETLARNNIKAAPHCMGARPGPKDHQSITDKFLSVFGVMYVIIKSQNDKGKALEKHLLKEHIVPRSPDANIEEIQEKHQQAMEEKDAIIAMLNDDLKNHEYENVDLQGEIRAKDQQIRYLAKTLRRLSFRWGQ